MTQLLESKLKPPHLRPSAVDRVRLIDRLGRDDVPKLVLMSAPPGFGKSTLAVQWIAALRMPVAVAWISLDAADTDAARFWRYVATAVERAAPGAGEAALGHLESGEGLELATQALVNGFASLERDVLVVLDDLHVIETREVADGLAFLLDHLPPRAHLMILTRADPPLPLARLRARGELAEVRAADLRFTPDEASAYLRDAMGLPLRDDEVGTLDARTEGWIAALQLAAISMRGRADVASFVAEFAGDDRYIVDYLADEVLERQPASVRQFLLETSILDRLTGPLCDAVTGGVGGAATLEALDRSNLFLIPLDDRRRWYRYHHLFADLLRARLLDQRPGEVPVLHRRASDWWEAQGDAREAIGHALAAGDDDRAADLIELSAHDLRRTRQEATLRAWLDALPDGIFERRPVLAIAHAGALLSTGEARGVERRLAAAERWVAAAASPEARVAAEAQGMVVRHASALAHLPGAISLYRAAAARMQGDADATVRQARAALEAAGDDQPLERGAAAGILALALWTAGDLEGAHAMWSGAVADLERAGHRADMLGGYLAMADIRAAQGRLADARRTLEGGMRLGNETTPPLRGTADMHVALAELEIEANDLPAALAHLDAAQALGDGLGLPQNPHRWRLAMAGVRAAQGDVAGALNLLDEAERVHTPDFFPEVRPIASVRARLWIRQGRAEEALSWAAARGFTPDDAPSYLHEHEHITLAKALMARGDREQVATASTLIDRLLAAAASGGRQRSVIELTALRAAALAASGDRGGATAAREQALSLAQATGLTRLLADLEPSRPGAARVGAPAQPLIEPLSERELDVLRLLATDLDGPEIAAQLFISLNTMRTHTKSIFAKLGVNSRRAAVTRAGDLGLLPRR